jgi:acyl CoA:acetate/3-ketoacid CoA transferase beta subunit
MGPFLEGEEDDIINAGKQTITLPGALLDSALSFE